MGISIVPTFWLLKGCQELWYSIQGFVWTRVFSILGCIPRSGISGSYGNSMFNLLRNFWPVFQNDYTILHSNVQWMRVSISLHSRQRLLSSVFFYFVHCRRCELISHWAFGLPFLANDGEHLLCHHKGMVSRLQTGALLYAHVDLFNKGMARGPRRRRQGSPAGWPHPLSGPAPYLNPVPPGKSTMVWMKWLDT